MAYSQTIYKQVLKGYAQDRDQSEKALDNRTQEIYARVPRIREIDNAISRLGLNAAKAILSKPKNIVDYTEELKKTCDDLIAEKAALLRQHGYAPDYLQPTYKCDHCQDTGFIGRQKCRCFSQRLIDSLYHQSGLGEILQYENFDNFDIRYYSEAVDPKEKLSPRENIKAILNTCTRFIEDFGSSFGNLYLYGKAGLGKTFLCHCIAREFLAGGHTAIYLTAFQLFKMIENYRFHRGQDEEEPENFDFLLEAELLIIDDLGTEFSTVLTSAELFNIINTRLNLKRPTIISTNLSPEDLISQYSDRTVSRIIGHYLVLRFFGDDIRLIKKYGEKSFH